MKSRPALLPDPNKGVRAHRAGSNSNQGQGHLRHAASRVSIAANDRGLANPGLSMRHGSSFGLSPCWYLRTGSVRACGRFPS